MTPDAPPPKEPLPVKKIAGIVAVAAVLVAIILARNSRVASPVQAPDSSLSDSVGSGTPATQVSPPSAPNPPVAQEQVERYPMLDCPDEIAPEQEFPIQVSLTEQQVGEAARILGGKSTADGKVILSLPAGEQSWKLQVVVTGNGLNFRGSSTGEIELPRQGDATTVLFYAKAGTRLPADGKIQLLATFWYQSRYLARIGRDIDVTAVTANGPSQRSVRTVGAIADSAADLNDQGVAPDLTLLIKNDSITINSPYLQPSSGPLKDSKGFSEWLQENSADIASAGRGSQPADTTTEINQDRAAGFGKLLYQNYAPDVFKSAFWALVDKRGSRFHTIQVYSDNPQIPWELMKPVRRGSPESGFLGLDYDIARWHVSDDGIQRDSPPSAETMPSMMVIAPQYDPEHMLKAEIDEIQGLSQLAGYSAVNGNRGALRSLFQNPPQGIVHFAGHGELTPGGGKFAILLEDGELDATAWRGMVKDSQNHPFFFFNACDVGQSKRTGNFVDGWAPAVLDAGASGYIGALFPVNDRVAADFAIYFYQLLQKQMQQGAANVSDTLTQTRRHIYQRSGNPTALAYVLYGDTNLKFVR
jgi:hypothetical protein